MSTPSQTFSLFSSSSMVKCRLDFYYMKGIISTMAYQASSNGGSGPPAGKNSFKKGLGFFPNSISRASKEPIKELLRAAPQITKGQCATAGKNASFYDTGSTIPIFDLETIGKTTGSERNRLIQAFGIGLTKVGFIAIKAENLAPLITQVHAEMKRYFCQPFERKILDWRSNEKKLCYSPRGSEGAARTKHADIRESFFITRNFRDWPRGFPSFSRVLSQYHSILSEYTKHLALFVMEYLGHSHEGMEKAVGQADNTLQLAHYPSTKPDDDPKALWAAPHFDDSLITIMSPGTIPGLQFLTNHGQWQPVIVPEGFLIMNAGIQLQHKTAGLIKTRLHRVVNPGGPYTRLERYETIFSSSCPEDFSLAPFKNCVELLTRGMTERQKEAYLKDYPDIKVYQRGNSGISLALI